MTRSGKRTFLFIALLACASAGSAQKARPQAELYKSLLDCRGITDDSQRLACYDRSTAAMQEAEKKNDLVVLDRKEMQETRKSLFGFTLPKLNIFGGGKSSADDKDDITQINSTVLAARSIGGGKWSISLANEAGTWEALDNIRFDPESGDKVNIEKASLGSYLGSVGINRGVRFRRVQ